MKAQAAVAEREEFKGNVAFVGTRTFWRPADQSPSAQGYHWNSNAETYYLIGEAMGEAMKRLLAASTVPSTDLGIGELLKALDGEASRARALFDLREMGIDAGPAVPRLMRLLDDLDEHTRAAAVDALGAIGTDATDAIPKLVEFLDEGELPRFSTSLLEAYSAIGIRASMALGQMGPDAVAPLERALTDESCAARSNAACALQEIGPAAKVAVPSLVRLLKDPDELVRERAIWALRDIRPDPGETTAALVECLNDANFNIRVAATNTLGTIRPMTPAALEGLLRALHDKEGNVQHEAAEVLGRLGDDARPAIPALTELLKSRAMYTFGHPAQIQPVAHTAAQALGALGARAESAVPVLLQVVSDRTGTYQEFGIDVDNRETRGAAAIAAARISPQSDDVLRILCQSLQDDEWIRADVAVALALIGRSAKGAVPMLLQITSEDRDPTYACAAVVIDPDNSVAVTTMLEHLPSGLSNYMVDWDLLQNAFARAGPVARPAIPVLIELIQEASNDQENLARILGTFGPDAESAIPALLDLLGNRWESAREAAIAALQRIASEKSEPLQAAFGQPNVHLRCGVVDVWGRFPNALPQITAALNDPSARVRLAALQALANLGDAARPAIPQIRGLLQADSRTTREAAAIAIQKVEH
jgi:HEAT repeat protein